MGEKSTAPCILNLGSTWVPSNNLIWAEIKFNVKKIKKCCKHLRTHLVYVTTEREIQNMPASCTSETTYEIHTAKENMTRKVKLSTCLIKYHDTKMYGGLKVYFNARVRARLLQGGAHYHNVQQAEFLMTGAG